VEYYRGITLSCCFDVNSQHVAPYWIPQTTNTGDQVGQSQSGFTTIIMGFITGVFCCVCCVQKKVQSVQHKMKLSIVECVIRLKIRRNLLCNILCGSP